MGEIAGVQEYSTAEHEGALDLDLMFAKESNALSAVLRHLLDHQGTIVACTR